jgi:GT2 family glycosyltransferase
MAGSPDSTGRVVITAVMPVFNSMRFLPATVPPLLAAGARHGGVEFIFIDNGSTDGTLEYLSAIEHLNVRVIRHAGVTIGALRNRGAAEGSGSLLSFIDSDCEVGEHYFEAAVAALARSGAAATGCEYDVPANAGWIEAAWHDLHFHGRERDVSYLNGGNFFITRDAFARVGGFSETLSTGEDSELGQRLNAAGLRIHANPTVRAVHLGNPQTLRQFYRRTVWHGLGMWGTVKRDRIDKPTAMMFAHLVATVVGVVVLFANATLALRLAAVVALQCAVPAMTVVYRARLTGRWNAKYAVRGVLLYWLYYWARLHSLAIIIAGQTRRYRK